MPDAVVMSILRPVLAVLLRAAALPVVAWAAFTAVDAASGPVVGANIGAGLVGLAAIAVASGTWAFVDGLRRSDLRPTLVRWVAVTVVAVPALAASGQWGVPGAFDLSVWRDDLLTIGWFDALLVAGPAALGAALGRAAAPGPVASRTA